MIKKRHQISAYPREDAVTRKSVGAAYPGSVRRDDADTQRSSVLVGRADIVATHESAMAVHHWRSVWIPIKRVSDIASAGERKFLIAEGTDHPETIQATHQG